MNQLLGIGDIGEFVGLNPDQGYWYSSKGKLPPADQEVGKRRFWYPFTIADWARKNRVGKYKFEGF